MFLSCPISPSCIDSSILVPLAKSARGLNWCLNVLTTLGQTCSLMLCVPLYRGCCVQYFWACSRCVGEFQTCVNIFGRVQQKFARSTLFGCVQHLRACSTKVGAFNIIWVCSTFWSSPPPHQPSADNAFESVTVQLELHVWHMAQNVFRQWFTWCGRSGTQQTQRLCCSWRQFSAFQHLPGRREFTQVNQFVCTLSASDYSVLSLP